jgi:hypothetical protein
MNLIVDGPPPLVKIRENLPPTLLDWIEDLGQEGHVRTPEHQLSAGQLHVRQRRGEVRLEFRIYAGPNGLFRLKAGLQTGNPHVCAIALQLSVSCLIDVDASTQYYLFGTLRRVEHWECLVKMMYDVQIIKRDGKKEYAIIPYADFLKMQEEIEDYKDLRFLREAKKIEKKAPTVGLSALKRSLIRRPNRLGGHPGTPQ